MRLEILSISSVLLASTHLASSASVTPVDITRYLQCSCTTFDPPARPRPCNIRYSQGLSWEAARIFAQSYNMEVRFDSKSMTDTLGVEEPLPTGVLLSMRQALAEPFDDDESVEGGSGRVDKMMCGLSEEMRRRLKDGSELDGAAGGAYVAKVIAALLGIIVLYAAGEAIWMNIQRRRRVAIKLSGEEKILTADGEPETCSTSESQKDNSASRTPSQPQREDP